MPDGSITVPRGDEDSVGQWVSQSASLRSKLYPLQPMTEKRATKRFVFSSGSWRQNVFRLKLNDGVKNSGVVVRDSSDLDLTDCLCLDGSIMRKSPKGSIGPGSSKTYALDA